MNSGIHLPLRGHIPTQGLTRMSLLRPMRLIHFVADDAQPLQPAAVELVRATEDTPGLTAMLVLDKVFNHSSWDSEGITFKQLESWSTLGRIYEFYRLCREYQPDAVFIHSQQNANWLRYASLRAGNIQVVHVNQQLREQIPYGIALDQFSKADEVPLGLRIPGIIMPSGFADQFHLQLIRALACLREKRLYPRVFLTGPGTHQTQESAQQLGKALGLDNQLRIASHCGNLPFLLMHHQISVVGNPDQNSMLVAQSMAAGCATIGIARNSAQTLIQHNSDGISFASDSPELLAEKLEELLRNTPVSQQLARTARLRAQDEFSLPHMQERYQQLYSTLFTDTAANGKAA